MKQEKDPKTPEQEPGLQANKIFTLKLTGAELGLLVGLFCSRELSCPMNLLPIGYAIQTKLAELNKSLT